MMLVSVCDFDVRLYDSVCFAEVFVKCRRTGVYESRKQK